MFLLRLGSVFLALGILRLWIEADPTYLGRSVGIGRVTVIAQRVMAQIAKWDPWRCATRVTLRGVPARATPNSRRISGGRV